MIDSFAFHLAAARVFLPQGFSPACIDAGFVFSCELAVGLPSEFLKSGFWYTGWGGGGGGVEEGPPEETRSSPSTKPPM